MPVFFILFKERASVCSMKKLNIICYSNLLMLVRRVSRNRTNVHWFNANIL